MITRRSLLVSAAVMFGSAILDQAAAAPDPDDPTAIVNAIYVRVAKGKGDGGGSFVIDGKAARAKYLSKPLIALWTKSDALTPKGEVGAIDFDPVTNSQDPDVKSFKVIAEKSEPAKATVAVTLASHRDPRKYPADDVVRYDFVREIGGWKIDDIRSTVDGKPWSVQELLKNEIKLLQGKKARK
jgi:hypothetical protein